MKSIVLHQPPVLTMMLLTFTSSILSFLFNPTASAFTVVKTPPRPLFVVRGTYNTQPTTLFAPSTTTTTTTRTTTATTTTQLFFFFGSPPPDDGKPGDYACKDCDYVFTKGPKAWSELPDNWSCPVCKAPKRRFTKVPKGSLTSNKKTNIIKQKGK